MRGRRRRSARLRGLPKPPPTDRLALALLLATGAGCAWVVSGMLSRSRGLVFFAGLLLPLAGAWLLAARGRRRPLYAVVFGGLLAATLVLSLEVVLRLWPHVLGGEVANVAYTGYHWHRGGIYRLDEHRGPVLRPGVSRLMYWSGHWWRHEANEAGYRGPAVTRADAVFLGDSMIYGHGVEGDQTLAAFFGRQTGLGVANLGQQGTCQIQSLLTWRALGRGLRPRYVFASVHFTDLAEVLLLYGDAEPGRFRDEPGYTPTVVPHYRPRPAWDPVSFWAGHVALPLRSAGILGMLAKAARTGDLRRSVEGTHTGRFLPTPDDLARPFPPTSPDGPESLQIAWAAEVQALARLQQEARESGARLVLFDIGYPRAFTRAVEEVAARIGAAYSPAGREVLARAEAGDDVYLVGDGHWTPLGNELMARALAHSMLSGGASALPPAPAVR